MKKEKVCKHCNKMKPLEEFHKNNHAKDGRLHICKECYHLVFKKKEITLETYPKRMYNNQRQNSKKRGRPYPNYSYEEFKEFLFKETDYVNLYKAYEESGFNKSLAPSTDRINPLGNYTFDNIQIITWRMNLDKAGKEVSITQRPNEIIHYTLEGKIVIYNSMKEASEVLGISDRHIYNSCNYNLHNYPNGIFRYKNLSEAKRKKLSKKLVQLLKDKAKPHGNKGKMSPKQKAHLEEVQRMNKERLAYTLPKEVLKRFLGCT